MSRIRHASAYLAVTSLITAGMAVVPVAATAGAAPRHAAPTLRTVVHAPTRAGGDATVDVYATNVRDLAGWELNGAVDQRGATLDGADSTATATAAAGFLDTSISDRDGSAVLAAYSPKGRTLSGEVRLGSFYVHPTHAGAVTLGLGGVRLVTADGRSIAGNYSGLSATITSTSSKGSAASRTSYGAPAAPYALPAVAAVSVKKAANPDVPGTWQTVRLVNAPCSAPAKAADRNGDGCLDVGDLVLNGEASQAGAPTVQLPAGAKQATSAPKFAAPKATPATASAATAPAAPAATGVTFVVNSTADDWDQNPGNGICKTALGQCTLRAAIQEANAAPGPNTIAFAIPGTGVQTIQLTKVLPGINDASGGTLIDGYTQPGSSPNTDPVADNAHLMIQVRGNGAAGDGTTSGFDAFQVTSAFNEIRGISMFNSRREVWIHGASATHNILVGDFVGTDSTGTFVTPQIELDAFGIHDEQDAGYVQIGTSDTSQPPTPADRNVISGNGRQGVGLWHNHTDYGVIVNNIVGLSPDGTRGLPNRKHGLDLNFGVSNTQIGGLRPGERNVISDNDDDGVEISHTTLTTQNDVIGNYIGTDLTGNAAFSWTQNKDAGVFIEDASTANTVEQNVIVNSANGGVVTTTNGTNGVTTQNVIKNNRIGVGINGAALPNLRWGVDLDGSGNTLGPGNIIANSQGPGVEVTQPDSVNNKITQNTITNNTGLAIDLSPIGSPNPNDPGDADTGANNGQNYPDNLTATSGTIAGTTCAGCTVEIYTTGSSTGSGPALAYQGSVTADPNTGAFSFANSLPVGTGVSAVTIAANGDTSEMAPNVTVVAAGNQPPTINAGPDITVDPASQTPLQATVTDPNGTTDTVTWDLDGNGTFETAGNPVTFKAPATGPATITVTAKATDPGGLTATDSLTITVRSAPLNPDPPTGRLLMPTEVTSGDVIPVSVDQPSAPGLTYAFDCGNGSGFGAASSTPSTSCASGSGPTLTVKALLNDPSTNLSTTYTAVVLVHTNLLVNGSLDAGTTSPTGWTWGGPQKQWVTSPVASGTHAVSSNGSGTVTNATMSQTYSALQDGQYLIDAKVNVPSTGSGSVQVLGRWLDASGNIQATVTIGTLSNPTSGFQHLTASFPDRLAASSLRVDVVWNTINRAITVDDLVLRRDNAVLNGEFDLDVNNDGKPDSWPPQSRFTRDSTVYRQSGFSGLATGDGGAFTVAQRVKAPAGNSYVVSGWINAPKTTDVYTITVQVRWTDNAFNLIRLDHITTFGGGGKNFGTPGWQQYAATLTPPAGATLGNLEMFFSAGFNGKDNIDSVVFGRQ